MENGLKAELDDSIGYGKYEYKNKNTDNSRNGHSHKNLHTSFGDVEISVPRDRKGEFEPQLVKKKQTSISQDIEDKIVSMYAKGMSASDIESRIQDIYGLSVSDRTISRITDKMLPLVREWQQRSLESLYAVVFMDAIHYHVRSEGQIVKKAVYISIGINLEGRMGLLHEYDFHYAQQPLLMFVYLLNMPICVIMCTIDEGGRMDEENIDFLPVDSCGHDCWLRAGDRLFYWQLFGFLRSGERDLWGTCGAAKGLCPADAAGEPEV